MTTRETPNIFPAGSTDALFRAWGKDLSDGLTAVGITKTADTGQINWATVTAPAASTDAGYEIRQMTDSLQATAPQYMKITYGSFTNQAPRLKFSTGTSTDGAGNLGGFGMGIVTISPNSSTVSTTVAYSMFLQGSTSSFIWVPWVGDISTQPFMSWERIKDSSGADTNKGTVFAWAGSGSVNVTQFINPQGAASTGGLAGGGAGMLPRSASTTLSANFGSNIPFAGVVCWVPSVGMGYTLNYISTTGINIGALFTCSRFGVSRTYRSVGSSALLAHASDSISGIDLLMLWE